MTYPQGEWVMNPVGYPAGAALYSGPVLFLPSNDVANTNTGILVLGPNGARANFPAIEQGETGPPASLSFSLVQVAYGTALPTPNPAVTESSPGVYTLTMYLNAGEPGVSGTFQMQNATDLSGTANIGWVTRVSGTGPTAFTYSPELGSGGYYSVTGGSASASNTTSPKNLAAIGIPAKPYAWWPKCSGQAQIVGASDTQVNLVARLTSTSGQLVGLGLGMAGPSPAPTVIQECGLAMTGPQIVPASTAATIYFNAENQTSSINPWNVAAGAFFGVQVIPVPTT